MTAKDNSNIFPRVDADTELTDEEINKFSHDLLAELTLDEKLGMMDADTPFWSGLADMMNGGYNAHPWPAGVISPLGIPGILFVDGPRGIILDGATTFPVSMARGASWDVDLEERVGDVIGVELRAAGGNFFGGVCINLLRHPAWGRAQETYGEDPYHLGEMGAALTRGVQKHAMACAKHYALNSMENARFKVDVSISPRALHEVYLPHFKRVVDEGVAAVMSAYNSVNGEWCGQNKKLLTEILKERWGFDGFVLSDFIFGMRDAGKAALAGQDLEMPFQMLYHQDLKKLVESGRVPLERIDDAVLRLLRGQIRLVRAGSYEPDRIGCDPHRALAREAAEKSIVLLKNEGHLLPLQDIKKIAVVGRLADTPNTGDGGSSNTRPAYVITPLQGIQTALEGKAEVFYDPGNLLERAKAVSKAVDAVVIVVGYTHQDEGEYLAPDTIQQFAPLFPPPKPEEMAIVQGFAGSMTDEQVGTMPPGGDRDSLTLHPDEETLIQSIVDVNPNVVVAVMSGSSVVMEAWRERVPAILMLWYPGMEGGHALADILLGKVNPSGKLPLVIPKDPQDLPYFDKNATEIEYDLWHGYRKLSRDGNVPAFPFGFGLSFTHYAYSNLALDREVLGSSDTLTVHLDINNIGTYAGEEVVQVYISAIGSKVERASKELKAFKRVGLQPGEKKTVVFDLPVSQLGYYDEDVADFVVEPLEYELFVGRHSLDDHGLTARFLVQPE